MAEPTPAPGGPKARKRNPLLPVLIVGGAGVAYFLYRRSKTAATATAAQTAANAQTAAMTPVAAGSYNPNADTSALLSYLTAQQGAGSTSGVAGLAPYTPPSDEKLASGSFGAGYGPSNMTPTTTQIVSNAGGQAFQWLASGQAAQAAQAGGAQLYFQPSPGVFSPITWNAATQSGLPLYLQVPANTVSGVQ